MRIAIIDIGTNTINLAIAVVDELKNYQIIFSAKETTRLGKGGINENTILPDAIDRAMEAIDRHVNTIAQFNVDKTITIGTSAMRSAENGKAFAEQIKARFGLDVRIISGDEEAQLIYDGVKQVSPIGSDSVLILDIGGGSNEFIICDKNGIIWKHSFEIGLARLLDRFKPSDPIKPTEIKAIENYIRGELTPLYEALHNYPTQTMIGTSGSFDTIATIVAAQKHPTLSTKLATSYDITVQNFDEFYRKIIKTNAQQRAEMPKMDPARIDLIVVGSVFINFIIREMRIQTLTKCSYALKQGAVYQFINGNL